MWTYAKKAFVALVLSFILMYAGLFSLNLSIKEQPQNECPEYQGTFHMDSFSIPADENQIGVFSEVKLMDADYQIKIYAPDQHVIVSINQKKVYDGNTSMKDIYLNVSKGDTLSIVVINENGASGWHNLIMYEPKNMLLPPPVTDTADNDRFFWITAWFLFILSMLFFVAGISWLYLLLRVEKRRGKFVSEPFKQPKKIPDVEDMPLAECPNCHKRIPADSKICPYCGTKFDSSIAICGSCGSPIPPDAVVCPYCGAKLR